LLSGPHIDNWPEYLFSEGVKYNKVWLHTHAINNIVSRIIEGMKGGEAKENE